MSSEEDIEVEITRLDDFELLEQLMQGAPAEMQVLLTHARERRALLKQTLEVLERENPDAPLTRQQAAALAALAHDAAISYANASGQAAALAVFMRAPA